jgi:hypothetical protein
LRLKAIILLTESWYAQQQAWEHSGCYHPEQVCKLIPVGAYAGDGVFHLHFGEAYELSIRRDVSAEQRDDQAVQIIMKNIARLLPLQLRGEFIEET